MTSTNVPATPKVSFHELQAKYQADVSALNKKHGAFFAFSDEQIAEQANDEFEYCQYGYGLVGPVGGGASYHAEADALFDAFTLNVRENVDRTAFIKYELDNLECYVTYDVQEVLILASHYWPDTTEADVMAIFNAEAHKYAW